MTADTVLIAAFSGRALAQSARRAGYIPLVADAFGDLDTRDDAAHVEVVGGAMQTGFRTKPMIAALDRLVAASASKPVGLVLGSGLEDKPRLVEFLHRRYGVLGCSVETLKASKDPAVFFAVLDDLKIPHPETRLTPPANPGGWLSKRIGGSGGRHIRKCTAASQAKPRRYFQKFIDGERISVSAVAADGIAMDITRQWCAPSETQPFRYGGAVSRPVVDSHAERQILHAVDQLSRALELKGIVSFDFILSGGTAYSLEINPRPGASLDVVDTDDGAKFKAHMTACLDGKLYFGAGSADDSAKAAAILHADRGAVRLGKCDWPTWAADRGAAGTLVPQGQPLATVFAVAPTSHAAEALARARLAELETLIYEHAIAL